MRSNLRKFTKYLLHHNLIYLASKRVAVPHISRSKNLISFPRRFMPFVLIELRFVVDIHRYRVTFVQLDNSALRYAFRIYCYVLLSSYLINVLE